MSITPTFAGGLGNIMFQLASSYGIAKQLSWKLYIQSNTHRRSQHSSTPYFEGLLALWKQFDATVKPSHIVNEHNLHPITIQTKGSYLVRGYLQNWAYFWNYRQEILDLLTFNTEIASKYPRLEESAFIHVRGGDYRVLPNHFVDLSVYYPRAIATVKAPHYYIFTNDEDYLSKQEWLSSISYTVVKENEVDSLYLMGQCKKGAICPNSTFSWWGAFLNIDRPICLPSKWFNDPGMYIHGFLFPGTTVIDVSAP
jgi:hypothetical protein